MASPCATSSTGNALIPLASLKLWTKSESLFENSSACLYGDQAVVLVPESRMTQEKKKVANARKFQDYSGERGNYKYAAI